MPKTVVLISNHGAIVGGGEISLLSLIEGLAHSQWRPVVVVPVDGEVASRCRKLDVQTQIVPLPGLRRPGSAHFRSVRTLSRVVSQTGAQLFHANGTRAMAYAGIAGWLAKRPVLWHVRVAHPEPIVDAMLGRLARVVVVNSRAVSRRFRGIVATRVRCIYNGVDVVRFSPRPASSQLRRTLGLPESGPLIVSVGRFVHYKGYDVLLDAVQLVAAAQPETHWLLIGEGELRAQLEERSRRLGLDKQVHFAGWREDVADLLALGDFFVSPAIGEHFGRVVIEAMALGKAVIATASGGTPEIVVHGETGLLVPPGDPLALAHAMQALLADRPRTERFGRAGRRRAMAEFDLRRHVQAITATYEECVRGSDGGL